MTIGENIRKVRESRGLRQSDLADRLNVAPCTVSSWEINRTEPKMGMIERICRALHCSKSDIITIEEMELNAQERAVIIAYRMNPNMQEAVNRLLGIEKKEESYTSRKEA